MPHGWKAGVLAGAASAIIYLSSATGLLIANLLSFFTPLPLIIAGLSAGASITAIGVAASLLIIILAANWALGLFFLGAVGLPTLGFIHLSLLNRTVVNEKGGQEAEWYPAGRLLIWLSGFAAGILIILNLGAHLFQGTGLLEYTRLLVIQSHGGRDQIAALLTAMESPLDPEQYISILSSALPILLTLNFSFMIAANAGLAQRFLVRKGRAIRPSPRIKDLELPEGLTLALAGSVGLWLLPGEIGVLGGSLAVIFLIPYFLLGLIVVHAISTEWSGRPALLTLFYLLCFLLYGLALLVALMGLAEQWVHIRQRYAAYAAKKHNP